MTTKALKYFKHINAATVEEAVSVLTQYGAKAKVIAGGTDLLTVMKWEMLPTYYEAIVNIKTIPGLSYVREEAGTLKIGALTTISEIAENATIKGKYAALAQAAGKVSAAPLRGMGTIGGNICQDVRCWYYRVQNNYFDCLRKNPAGPCFVVAGDNRYHSIFGGVHGCFAVNPGDMAPALVALGAKMKTSKRTLDAKDLLAKTGAQTTVLDYGEIVTEIQVPEPAAGTKSTYIKFALRRAIDFPIVSCAAVIGGGKASIVLGAVYNNPYRATKAESAIAGKAINEANAEAAATAAVDGAAPMTKNRYKIQIAKTITKRAILACA